VAGKSPGAGLIVEPAASTLMRRESFAAVCPNRSLYFNQSHIAIYEYHCPQNHTVYLFQAKTGARKVVVVETVLKNGPEVSFADDDHAIQAFAEDGPISLSTYGIFHGAPAPMGFSSIPRAVTPGSFAGVRKSSGWFLYAVPAG